MSYAVVLVFALELVITMNHVASALSLATSSSKLLTH
jgi:hypothetical protein